MNANLAVLILILLLLAMALSGCGDWNKSMAGLTGKQEVCVSGVKYLQFPSGVTVKYNQDGSIATC